MLSSVVVTSIDVTSILLSIATSVLSIIAVKISNISRILFIVSGFIVSLTTIVVIIVRFASKQVFLATVVGHAVFSCFYVATAIILGIKIIRAQYHPRNWQVIVSLLFVINVILLSTSFVITLLNYIYSDEGTEEENSVTNESGTSNRTTETVSQKSERTHGTSDQETYQFSQSRQFKDSKNIVEFNGYQVEAYQLEGYQVKGYQPNSKNKRHQVDKYASFPKPNLSEPYSYESPRQQHSQQFHAQVHGPRVYGSQSSQKRYNHGHSHGHSHGKSHGQYHGHSHDQYISHGKYHGPLEPSILKKSSEQTLIDQNCDSRSDLETNFDDSLANLIKSSLEEHDYISDNWMESSSRLHMMEYPEQLALSDKSSRSFGFLNKMRNGEITDETGSACSNVSKLSTLSYLRASRSVPNSLRNSSSNIALTNRFLEMKNLAEKPVFNDRTQNQKEQSFDFKNTRPGVNMRDSEVSVNSVTKAIEPVENSEERRISLLESNYNSQNNLVAFADQDKMLEPPIEFRRSNNDMKDNQFTEEYIRRSKSTSFINKKGLKREQRWKSIHDERSFLSNVNESLLPPVLKSGESPIMETKRKQEYMESRLNNSISQDTLVQEKAEAVKDQENQNRVQYYLDVKMHEDDQIYKFQPPQAPKVKSPRYVNSDSFQIHTSPSKLSSSFISPVGESSQIPHDIKDEIESLLVKETLSKSVRSEPEAVQINTESENSVHHILPTKKSSEDLPYANSEFSDPMDEIHFDNFDQGLISDKKGDFGITSENLYKKTRENTKDITCSTPSPDTLSSPRFPETYDSPPLHYSKKRNHHHFVDQKDYFSTLNGLEEIPKSALHKAGWISGSPNPHQQPSTRINSISLKEWDENSHLYQEHRTRSGANLNIFTANNPSTQDHLTVQQNIENIDHLSDVPSNTGSIRYQDVNLDENSTLAENQNLVEKTSSNEISEPLVLPSSQIDMHSPLYKISSQPVQTPPPHHYARSRPSYNHLHRSLSAPSLHTFRNVSDSSKYSETSYIDSLDETPNFLNVEMELVQCVTPTEIPNTTNSSPIKKFFHESPRKISNVFRRKSTNQRQSVDFDDEIMKHKHSSSTVSNQISLTSFVSSKSGSPKKSLKSFLKTHRSATSQHITNHKHTSSSPSFSLMTVPPKHRVYSPAEAIDFWDLDTTPSSDRSRVSSVPSAVIGEYDKEKWRTLKVLQNQEKLGFDNI
jgi:hypothetical protein